MKQMIYCLAPAVAIALGGCAGEDPATPEPETETAAENAVWNEEASVPRLEQAWVLDGFSAPEGVTLSADGSFFYVSNVVGDGSAVDGDGFISRISTDGEMLEREWATGLDAPKGMALHDGSLYVSDITSIRRIDTATGEVVETMAVEGSDFLNDVTADPALGVLVSDSRNAIIHQYRDGALSTFLEDERLGGINGLLVHEGAVIAATMAAGEILSIDPKTKEMTTLGSGMENADMMAPWGGGWLVSSWPGILWFVTEDGETVMLQDTREDQILMNDFAMNGDMLVVPNWQPGTVTAYRVVMD